MPQELSDGDHAHEWKIGAVVSMSMYLNPLSVDDEVFEYVASVRVS